MSKDFTPSEYQKAIFDFVVNGEGDGMVSAVAGSGKTTTLVHAAELIPTDADAVFLAFNKHIAEELTRRLRGTPMTARTIHSLGMFVITKSFGRVQVDDRKYTDICRDLVGRSFPELAYQKGGRATANTYAAYLEKMVRLSRLTLTDDPASLEDIAWEHGMDLEGVVLRKLIGLAPQVKAEGLKLIDRKHLIDFTDMVWAPIALNLPSPNHYDWIFIDEAQDLSAAQRELVLRHRAPGGRMLFVGDPRQAIMAFAGADANSYWTIKEVTGATELPLSICYRCPRTHIELAQAIVPDILPRDGAPEGTIATIDQKDLRTLVSEGDLILCRTTAPLVSECINMIRHKIPARVRGRDVAATLTNLARKVGTDVPFDHFVDSLEAYRASQTDYLLRREKESQLIVLNDTCDALIACYEDFGARNLDDLCQQIDGIFSDGFASIWLSTVHKAKGLEADRVFILHPEKLPLRWKRQSNDALTQEWNLKYVAMTRAKASLTWVNPPDNGGQSAIEKALQMAMGAVA